MITNDTLNLVVATLLKLLLTPILVSVTSTISNFAAMLGVQAVSDGIPSKMSGFFTIFSLHGSYRSGRAFYWPYSVTERVRNSEEPWSYAKMVQTILSCSHK